MATLLWLANGVLVALLAWILPVLSIAGPLVAAGLAVVGILVPRNVTSAGAKLAIGFGATYAVLFGPRVVGDPLAASAASYLLFGGGVVLTVLGLVAVIRNHRRRQRARAAALAQL